MYLICLPSLGSSAALVFAFFLPLPELLVELMDCTRLQLDRLAAVVAQVVGIVRRGGSGVRGMVSPVPSVPCYMCDNNASHVTLVTHNVIC